MRKALVALLPLIALLASCQRGVTMWGSCSAAPGADATGTDGEYVLVCRNGRWEPAMTTSEFVKVARKQPVKLAPLPAAPSTTAPVTTTTAAEPAPTTTTTTAPPLPSSFVAIEAASDYTCGLTDLGGVKCWGANSVGQLGDGTTTRRSTPVDVVGLSSGVASISSMGSHSCAVMTGGGLKCWGYNGVGELGDGTTINRSEPVDVVGLSSGVATVQTGASFTCVLTTTGGVKCWGYNHVNQLGDGTTTTRTSPTDVSGLTSGVAAIDAGVYHSCALTTTGGMKCWGLGLNGRIGDGATISRSTPVDVTGLTSGVASMSVGQTHTCAVTTGGGAKCWGTNNAGRVGDGTTVNRTTPVDVTGLTSGIATISAGDRHTCAITTGGGIKCWGFNGYGQFGNGGTASSNTAVDVTGLSSGVTSLSSGNQHTCAIVTSAPLRCWGANYEGQIGVGDTTDRTSPTAVDL